MPNAEALSVKGMWAGATYMAGEQMLTTQKLCDGFRRPHTRAVLRVRLFILATCMHRVEGW